MDQEPISLRMFHHYSNMMEISFVLTQIQMNGSLQNDAHDTTAVLSWHVQNFVAVW